MTVIAHLTDVMPRFVLCLTCFASMRRFRLTFVPVCICLMRRSSRPGERRQVAAVCCAHTGLKRRSAADTAMQL